MRPSSEVWIAALFGAPRLVCLESSSRARHATCLIRGVALCQDAAAAADDDDDDDGTLCLRGGVGSTGTVRLCFSHSLFFLDSMCLLSL